MTSADSRVLTLLENEGFKIGFEEDSLKINDFTSGVQDLLKIKLKDSNQVLRTLIKDSCDKELDNLEGEDDPKSLQLIESLSTLKDLL